jgi:hypothetical protein
MALVKSLHIGDSGVIQTHGQVPDVQGASLATAIRIKTVKSLLPISLHSSFCSRY